MKKLLLFFIFIFCLSSLHAQLAPHKYLVRFTDKNNNPYTIADPSQFLSSMAITRRQLQGISINERDLPLTPAYVDSVLNTGITLLCKSKWFNSITIFTTDSAALVKIKSLPFVVSVDSVARMKNDKLGAAIEENFKFMPESLIDNEKLMSVISSAVSEKTHSFDYGLSYNQAEMISVDFLHNQNFCGQGVIIAVIDAGFFSADTLPVFDSLWANGQILGTRDFVEPGANVFEKSTHGMMVLSTMGGNIPGQLIGTAPKASFWLLRSEDAGSEYIIEEYNWASAAEFADSAGADIINSSLGYTVFNALWMDHTYSDMNGKTTPVTIAATYASRKGMIVCSSAGNSGASPWHYISSPADADSIITVGAVDDQGNYAAFSSTGPTADGRIKPTVATQGQGTVIASSGGGVVTGNGTSFSSPVMAGATACLFQAFPSMSNMQIIDAIKESSSQFSNPDSLLGYGIPNFAAAYLMLSGTQISDFDKQSQVTVFPNPFRDILYLCFFSIDTETVDIEIYDINGKSVYAELGLQRNTGYNYFSIGQLNAFPNGLYALRIVSNRQIFTRKVLKMQ